VRRRRGGWGSVAAVVVAVLALSALSSALAIAYTVQVIAVSDQDAAIGIYRDLARVGFPAYVVRTTGAQGDVYRVRVGAFANRAAAVRYAESMPDVGGARPVPALAEAIPLGIMPLAPRLLWQHPWAGEDVRMVPWPGGVAVRVQPLDPLRQASYAVFQDGEERRFDAWLAAPLRALPTVADIDLLDVPLVDLTAPAPPPAVPDPPVEAAGAPAGEAAAEGADAQADDVWEPFLARPDDTDVELGLVLLRDRSLWPPSWQSDDETVRNAFGASLVALVARALDVTERSVRDLVYSPSGEPPPSLIVLDVSDRSARDAGALLALADPGAGIGPEGSALVLPADTAWTAPSWPSTVVLLDAASPPAPVGGSDWSAVADGLFVRLTLADGTTWRAGVGAPVWSDGRSVLAWDGERLLLYDFVPR
jgi:hypothetical protein